MHKCLFAADKISSFCVPNEEDVLFSWTQDHLESGRVASLSHSASSAARYGDSFSLTMLW